MRIGFVASVGGMKLVAAVGHAEAMVEVGLWSQVAGFAAASGGAPWCALLASGLSVLHIKDIARSVRRRDYWNPNWWTLARIGFLSGVRRQLGATIGEVGLDNGRAMEGWLERNLPMKTFEELARPLAIPVTVPNLRTVVTLTSGPLIPAIRATTAIPGIYKPATMMINGHECKATDGGVARAIPVGDLLTVAPDVDIIVAVVACNRGDDSPYVRPRDMDAAEWLDAHLDILVYDHIQTVLGLAAERAPIVLLPVRIAASMAHPETTIGPALMEARQQGREFFASGLWREISADPAGHRGQVHTFN